MSGTTPDRTRIHASAFLAWGIIPTGVAAVLLARGPVRPVELGIAIFAAAWWVVGARLRRGVPGAAALAMGLVAVPWSLVLVQTIRRVTFVAREGRLEGADGHGSPLAFLLGLATEQLLIFLPLSILGVLLWRSLRCERARATS